MVRYLMGSNVNVLMAFFFNLTPLGVWWVSDSTSTHQRPTHTMQSRLKLVIVRNFINHTVHLNTRIIINQATRGGGWYDSFLECSAWRASLFLQLDGFWDFRALFFFGTDGMILSITKEEEQTHWLNW